MSKAPADVVSITAYKRIRGPTPSPVAARLLVFEGEGQSGDVVLVRLTTGKLALACCVVRSGDEWTVEAEGDVAEVIGRASLSSEQGVARTRDEERRARARLSSKPPAGEHRP